MSKKSRNRFPARCGYDPKTGRARDGLPKLFWKDRVWNTKNIPEHLTDPEMLIECMNIDQIADFLTQVCPNSYFTYGQVSQWFQPSEGNSIPGVYHSEDTQMWVHREIVHQIKGFILTDKRIVWYPPEKKSKSNKPVSNTNTVILKEVPRESVILQRLGAISGQQSQLIKRIQALEEERRATREWEKSMERRFDNLSQELADLKRLTKEEFSDTRIQIDEVSKKQTLTSSWLRENFSPEWKEAGDEE